MLQLLSLRKDTTLTKKTALNFRSVGVLSGAVRNPFACLTSRLSAGAKPVAFAPLSWWRSPTMTRDQTPS
jgi:hypothetical protein